MRLIRKQPRNECRLAPAAPGNGQGKSYLRVWWILDGCDECTMNPRISLLAHEISPRPDKIIKRLRRRRSVMGQRAELTLLGGSGIGQFPLRPRAPCQEIFQPQA